MVNDQRAAIDARLGYQDAAMDFRIRAETTALLVVDLQYGSASRETGWMPLYLSEGRTALVESYLKRVSTVLIPNVAKLQAQFRSLGSSVVFLVVGSASPTLDDLPRQMGRVAQYWRKRADKHPFASFGTKDTTVLQELAPRSDETVITKSHRSGFTASPLETVLITKGIRELVVCGVATNACVEFTVRDAIDRGFDCVVVEDACAAVTPAQHELGIRSMANFCRVASTESVIEDLARSNVAGRT